MVKFPEYFYLHFFNWGIHIKYNAQFSIRTVFIFKNFNILFSRKIEIHCSNGQSLTVEQRNVTTDLIYLYLGFAAFADVNPSWLTDWIIFIGLQKSQELGSGEMTLFYRSNRQQTDLLTIRATLLEIKQRSSELEVIQQWVIKIRVNYDLKQSTFGSSSTIHFNWGKR